MRGEPMPETVTLPIGTAEPQHSTPLAAKMTITGYRHPSPCLARVAGPCCDGLSIPEHSGQEA
jgi:hypothetical protein